jgi:hypothetical protein
MMATRSVTKKNVTRKTEHELSLLDVVDNVVNRGVLLNGDLILGVANVDLIYAKLSVLLAAIDKLMSEEARNQKRRRVKENGKRKNQKTRTRGVRH